MYSNGFRRDCLGFNPCVQMYVISLRVHFLFNLDGKKYFNGFPSFSLFVLELEALH